jgi:hypothetical protein
VRYLVFQVAEVCKMLGPEFFESDIELLDWALKW